MSAVEQAKWTKQRDETVPPAAPGRMAARGSVIEYYPKYNRIVVTDAAEVAGAGEGAAGLGAAEAAVGLGEEGVGEDGFADVQAAGEVAVYLFPGAVVLYCSL